VQLRKKLWRQRVGRIVDMEGTRSLGVLYICSAGLRLQVVQVGEGRRSLGNEGVSLETI
jgi:hypothetical protein